MSKSEKTSMPFTFTDFREAVSLMVPSYKEGTVCSKPYLALYYHQADLWLLPVLVEVCRTDSPGSESGRVSSVPCSAASK